MNMDDIFFLSKGSSICQGIASPSYTNWGRSVCQGILLHFDPEVVTPKHTIECLVLFISSSSGAKARVVLNSITIVIIRLLFQISTENCLTFQTNLLAQIHNFSEPRGTERIAQLNRSPALCQILLICWSWCLDTKSKASSKSACELCLAYGCPKSRGFDGRMLFHWPVSWVHPLSGSVGVCAKPPSPQSLGATQQCPGCGWDTSAHSSAVYERLGGKITVGAWLLLLIIIIRTLADVMWWRDSWV